MHYVCNSVLRASSVCQLLFLDAYVALESINIQFDQSAQEAAKCGRSICNLVM